MKHYRIANLLFFLLLQPIFLFAFTSKSITGVVYNGLTNKPLSNIQISIKGFEAKTVSDKDGKYTISIPDTIKTIDFEVREGIEIMEVKNNSLSEIDVYVLDINIVNLSIDDLMNIKITTAGKQEQRIAEIPASVVVITRSDIEAYGYQSIKEILSNVLGMYKIDDYRNVSFGVRGFFSNVFSRNIVFLINGIQQQQPLQNWNDLNIMNLQVESIERIEIVRGPNAIIYGNDAFFGAINIITHQNGKETNSSFTSSYGSDNTYRANFQINTTNETTTINLSAGTMHSDGRDVPFNESVDSVERYNHVWLKDATTKNFLSQNNQYINISVAHQGFYGNLSFDESHRNFINAPIVYDTTKVNRVDHILRSNIGYKKDINPYLKIDMHLNYENMYWKNDLVKWYATPNIEYGYTIAETNRIFSEIITFIRPVNTINITLGVNYSRTPNSSQFTDVPAKNIFRSSEDINSPVNVYGAFSQVEYSVSKNILLLVGIRADKQEPYDFKNIKFLNGTSYHDTIYRYTYNKTNVIPRLAGVYTINEQNILKLMYSQAISRPGTYENRYILWVKHPQLVPQTIKTTEFNYNLSTKCNTYFNFSVFYNKLNNLINRRNYTPATGVPVNENNNSGKMETIGGEFQSIYKPTNNLTLDGSFSYQKTTNIIFDNDAANSPNWLAYFKLIYNLQKNVIVGVNSYYVGSILSEWDESAIDAANNNFSPKGRIDSKTSGYFNLGANVRINNIANKGIFVSLHAENMLNSKILYPPTSANKAYFPKGTMDNGIQINATLGFKF